MQAHEIAHSERERGGEGKGVEGTLGAEEACGCGEQTRGFLPGAALCRSHLGEADGLGARAGELDGDDVLEEVGLDGPVRRNQEGPVAHLGRQTGGVATAAGKWSREEKA